MSEETNQALKALIEEANRIIKNACKIGERNGERNKAIVKIKDFSVKFLWLDELLKCENKGDIENKAQNLDKLNWRGNKKLKILPLIVTTNLYILPVLATLSKILALKNEKDLRVEVDFLFGKGVIEHSEYLKEPFRDNFSYIMEEYEDALPTLIEMNFKELSSLLNIIIANLRLERIREVLGNVHYWDIEDYCGNIGNGIDMSTISKSLAETNDRVKDVILNDRVKDVILNKNYCIMEKLLNIIINIPRNYDDRIIFILIVTIPMRDLIWKVRDLIWKFFKDREGTMPNNSNFSNILIASYSNLVDEKDPEVIIKKIPSYLTILSQYLNLKEIVYAIDEYLYSKMLDAVNSRLFECEKFYEEIEKERKGSKTGKDAWEEKKIEDIEEIRGFMEEGNMEQLEKKIKEYKEKYVRKQEKILEFVNNGFLTIQNSTSEQLRLIL